MDPSIVIGLNAVIVAVTEEVPRILTVRNTAVAAEMNPPHTSMKPRVWEALPFGPLDPAGDRTLERGLRKWVRDQTGLELGYVEQLYTFGDRHRDPAEERGGPRVVSVAYLGLARQAEPSGAGEARWIDCYRFFPWEDWRTGRSNAIRVTIAPTLGRWVRSAPDGMIRRERRERVDIAFGLGGAPWDGERVLERYELLYEAELAEQADRGKPAVGPPKRIPMRSSRSLSAHPHLGEPMALDHRRILATALGRLRAKLKYRPVVFELLPPTFTLLQLQRVVEALAGLRLHKQNLRRLLEHGGLVEGTGRLDPRTGGRPAELFRFRREVLRERPAPGVGLPGLRHAAGWD